MQRTAILAVALVLGTGCASETGGGQAELDQQGAMMPNGAGGQPQVGTPPPSRPVATAGGGSPQPVAPPMGRPVAAPPMDSTPVDPGPMNPGPMNPGPMNQVPMDQAPMDQAPMDQAPMDQAPMDQAPMDQAPMTPIATDGPQPVIPAVSGACPEFRDGATISVGGHGGVLIMAGPAGMGGPLLFYWHGTGGSASEAMRTLPASVRNDIKSQGGIIASFNGRDSAGTGRDCSGTSAHNMADFDAADQIVACAVENHGIDPRRIYSTGCSAGGLQTGCMANMRSSYMAAVAPNSGGVVIRQSLEDPGNVPALFTMHGGSGDNVIVNFGDTSRTLGQAFTSAGGFWIDCNHMIGHCRAPSALQEAAWEFLKAHPFGTDPSPYASGLPASFPDYCSVQ